MKFRFCLILTIGLISLGKSAEIPFSKDPLLKNMQVNVLGKFHDSGDGIMELQKKASSDLYNQSTRESAVNLLVKLALIMQDPAPLVTLGDYFSAEEGELRQAITHYTTAVVNFNSSRAMFKLARLYLEDECLNKEIAQQLLLRGSAANDDYCLCALAKHYLEGTFAKPDPVAALALYKQSAVNKFELAITEYARLLNSTIIFPKPDSVHAYENLILIPKDNRARIGLEGLNETEGVKLYQAGDYLGLAQAYACGSFLPERLDRTEIFLNKAYLAKQITKAEKKYYSNLVSQGLAWAKPSGVNLFMSAIF